MRIHNDHRCCNSERCCNGAPIGQFEFAVMLSRHPEQFKGWLDGVKIALEYQCIGRSLLTQDGENNGTGS